MCLFLLLFCTKNVSWRKFYRNRTEAFYNWKSEVVCAWLDLLISQRLRNFIVGEILEYLCHPSSQVHSVNIGQLLRVQVCVLQPLGKAASGQAQLSCKRCLLFGLPGSHLNRVGSKGVVCLNGAEHRDLSQGSMNTFVDTQQFSLTNPHPGLLCHSSAFHSWSYLVGREKWFQFPNKNSLTCCKAVRKKLSVFFICCVFA